MREVAIVVGGATIVMDVTAYVKWENRAAKVGKNVADLLSSYLNK